MNLQKMMKQAQEMQNKMTAVQSEIEATEMDGASGGGMVSVRINGRSNLLEVNIDESLLKPDEKEMLEDLIIAAFNDAKTKMDNESSEKMNAITKGMNLPAGMKLPF
ncbi:MAG: YbaB/EbfC family nucleoid-associated protein [Rickettsiales bacterium]